MQGVRNQGCFAAVAKRRWFVARGGCRGRGSSAMMMDKRHPRFACLPATPFPLIGSHLAMKYLMHCSGCGRFVAWRDCFGNLCGRGRLCRLGAAIPPTADRGPAADRPAVLAARRREPASGWRCTSARWPKGGNGCFTAESRPHSDWLGPGWCRDLAICLEAAKKHNLQMWIFDEKWWPSQGVGGKVPPRYAAKRLAAAAVEVEGPRDFAGRRLRRRALRRRRGRPRGGRRQDRRRQPGRPGPAHPRRQALLASARPASGRS